MKSFLLWSESKLGSRCAQIITFQIGKAGKIGTPIVWLYPAGPPPKLIPGLFDGILAQETITGANLIVPMRGSPLSLRIAGIRAGNVYVNIHTKTHAHGDICWGGFPDRRVKREPAGAPVAIQPFTVYGIPKVFR
ncbi:hypothetical protein [Desulfobacterium sp. N47]|uniref:hypothetical protein n=1 Tax=Desulfobacterium sp. N47 TaxID=3115210 RepID=UPI003F49B80E